MEKYTALRVLIGIHLILILFISNSFAQEVEHNYQVGPQVTNCDSLSIKGNATDQAISSIRNTKFRFKQSFKLTRKTGFKGAEFYSCDSIAGYLIVRIDENEYLYLSVDKVFWESLIVSSDPEGYYLERKTELQQYK